MSWPPSYSVYSCPVDQMFTAVEQITPPECTFCHNCTRDVFMRIFKQVQPMYTFCTEQCFISWSSTITPHTKPDVIQEIFCNSFTPSNPKE
jgi:hypothetical protein